MDITELNNERIIQNVKRLMDTYNTSKDQEKREIALEMAKIYSMFYRKDVKHDIHER